MLGHTSVESSFDVEVLNDDLNYPVDLRQFIQVVLDIARTDEFCIALVHQHLGI